EAFRCRQLATFKKNRRREAAPFGGRRGGGEKGRGEGGRERRERERKRERRGRGEREGRRAESSRKRPSPTTTANWRLQCVGQTSRERSSPPLVSAATPASSSPLEARKGLDTPLRSPGAAGLRDGECFHKSSQGSG